MTTRCECAECGEYIALGDEYVMTYLTGDRMFCTTDCLKKFLKDSPKDFEEIIDDWTDDNAEVYDREEEDLYSRYGVRESDFR